MKILNLGLLFLLQANCIFVLGSPELRALSKAPAQQTNCVRIYYDAVIGNDFFAYNKGISRPNEWQYLDKILQEHNFHLEVTNKFTPQVFKSSAKIICCNIPRGIKGGQYHFPFPHQSTAILIAFEPSFSIPELYSKDTHRHFHKVLTWDDTLIDNKKLVKFHYPVFKPMIESIPSFSEKKLLTLIASNIYWPHQNGLYVERLEVVEYFENKQSRDFDFYGRGWPANKYRNYKGAPADKISVLQNYKFNICYENTKGLPGYITEKIFDCFAAGCVPIYLGASNVRKFIPENCFIPRENFSSLDELVDFLQKMDEPTYNQYLQNIRNFLQTEQAKKFSKEAFAQVVLQALEIPD